MIGSTGSGKTEIARRVARMTDAPFIKVEATKYTEVGFHGKDVESVIQDLVGVSIQITRAQMMTQNKAKVEAQVEEAILDALIGTVSEGTAKVDTEMRDDFRKSLRAGELEDTEIDVEMSDAGGKGKASGGEGFEQQVHVQIVSLMQNMSHELGRNGSEEKSQKMKVSAARRRLEELAAADMCPEEEVVRQAVERVEQSGIVVIDEIDKICKPSGMPHYSADASAEGVQRDLLPIIEGTIVSTKQGNVDTSKILFIAAGAFHSVKPEDMLAELQGRLPIRVELSPLSENDLYRVMTETESNLLDQQVALLAVEKVNVIIEDEAIREIARISYLLNQKKLNIGARQLHFVIEKVFEDVSFDMPEGNWTLTAQLVRDKMVDALKLNDMSRFLI